ncbi:MAG: hypothetical protein K9W46_12620 [Candidatus Heimdallarchaeum endolithica]|uniref:Uncharacterized protein n=1 Tax=Candidatus Heimdallarchaeum endolithica TaxID=2876572 RepID=A0A9Y1BQP6_9ARCH|nr:MAG: hypothetical protein K9W46_12620 [Candidatus Heimdallarchaeum endolithica]
MTFMLDIRVILPVISIISFGSIEVLIIKKLLKSEKKQTFFEIILDSTVLGTISLVGPMIFFGLLAYNYPNQLTKQLMSNFVYTFLTISIAIFLYYLFHFLIKILPKTVLKGQYKYEKSISKILVVVIFLILCAYTFQALVSPIRGWDALHFYLPNAFRIFATGELGKINELNFLPMFKPPLNVMLYAFTFFITLSEMIQLVPMLFFSLTVYLCYKIARIEGLSEKYSNMSTIAFLVTPFVYFLIYEYQYYQEIYIMFFTTASYYYYKKFIQSTSNKDQIFYTLLTSASFAGCVLSKISGFIIPLIIFAAMDSDKVGKVLRILLVFGFVAQIARKSLFDIYIGTSIFIVLAAIYCAIIIIQSETLNFSYKRWFFTVIIFSFPIFVGYFWAQHMLRITGVEEMLRNTYWDPRNATFNLSWKGISLPFVETYLENAHTATFVTSTFAILIATMFAPSWLFVKLTGLFCAHKKNKHGLIIWLVFFYIFWQGFFALGSIRYLSPIVVPLTIIVIFGFKGIVNFFNEKFNLENDGFFAFIFLALTAFLSLYPVFPFEVGVIVNFHERWYKAHTHVGSIIGFSFFLTLIVFLFIWKEKSWNLSFTKIYSKKKSIQKISTTFMLFVLIFVPMAAQAALITYCKFNINEYQHRYSYYTRTNYEELKNAINRLGASDWETILSINTPGIEYYVSQPTIDVYMFGSIQSSGIKEGIFPLDRENVTRLFNFFNKYNVSIFVSQNQKNDWYKAFIEKYYWKYYIFRILANRKLFTLNFYNEEYLLYTFNNYDFSKPYIGPVEFLLKNENSKTNLFSNNFHKTTINGSKAQIDLIQDFTAIPTKQPFNLTISTEYSSFREHTRRTSVLNYTIKKPEVESFNQFTLLTLEQSSYTIFSIDILISYYHSNTNEIETQSYHVSTLSTSGLNIYYYNNSWFTYGINGFTIK